MRLELEDGGWLAWERHGAGGAVVLVAHGGGRLGKHYRDLASRLVERGHEVVLYDRRGHGESSAVSAAHSLELEAADLVALADHVGAQFVFGHSAGAMVTLEALRTRAFAKAAVYEPPIAFERFAPLQWWPAFERALARRDEARAFALFASGLDFGPPRWLPLWALTLGVRVLMRGTQGREFAALMHTVPADLAIARQAGPDASRFADLRAPLLVLSGRERPRFIQQGLELLAEALPGARRDELEGQGHNAPDLTGVDVTAHRLADWFGAPAV